MAPNSLPNNSTSEEYRRQQRSVRGTSTDQIKISDNGIVPSCRVSPITPVQSATSTELLALGRKMKSEVVATKLGGVLSVFGARPWGIVQDEVG